MSNNRVLYSTFLLHPSVVEGILSSVEDRHILDGLRLFWLTVFSAMST